MIYIHYGATQYKPELFKPIKNELYFVKPNGGLWASPVDTDIGWKDWCEQEDFRDCSESESFRFKLDDSANVLIIDSVEQLLNLPKLESMSLSSWINLDFERLVKDGIDAIQVNISNDYDLYYKLYGWDCDSILIMNKDMIQEM